MTIVSKYHPVSKYDNNGNMIYHAYSSDSWFKQTFDENSNKLSYEDATGYWSKYKYDSKGNEVYYENSDGKIEDNR